MAFGKLEAALSLQVDVFVFETELRFQFWRIVGQDLCCLRQVGGSLGCFSSVCVIFLLCNLPSFYCSITVLFLYS